MIRYTGEFLFLISLILYISGAILAIAFSSHHRLCKNLSYAFSLAASIISALCSLYALISGTIIRFSLSALGGLIPHVKFEILMDSLSAYFVFAISFLACTTSIFSFGYVKEYENKRNVGFLGFMYNLFLFSMILVVTANNALMFLIVWEVMSLVSFFLVTYEHESPLAQRAGLIYIVMTHVGTAFIMLSFLVFFGSTGSLDFDAFREAKNNLPIFTKNIVFIFMLIGFGTKAGIIPLHVWMPLAHPSAPSNISALMSGVMIKTAIYGIIRMVFDFLGAGPQWWGFMVLVVGSVSALLGVMYALMEHDLKRLLAYHSVENIGIILLGVGASMVFVSLNHRELAALAIIAGLYHVVNHAVFKGLLFLCSGSVLYATHTRNIEDLGGLIKRMPWTAFFFLIGAISISAMPPFNGFISEWLTYQSLLLGFSMPSNIMKVFAPLCVTLLALTGALAAACFVKAFGITFLAMPRSHHVEKAKEVAFSMKLAMGILSTACVILGLFPTVAIRLLDNITNTLLGQSIYSKMSPFGGLTILPVDAHFASLSTFSIVLLCLALIPMPFLLIYFIGGRLRSKTYETWGCGIDLNPRMEYTATAFSKPIRIIFSKIYRPSREVETTYEVPRYFAKTIKYRGEITPIFEKYLYIPVTNTIIGIATKIRGIQMGSIHVYLTYIFITCILLLIFARFLG